MDKYTMINKDWYSKERNMLIEFGHEAFTILILLLKRRTARKEVIFSIDYIRKSLGIKPTSTDAIKRIIRTLKKFEREGFLNYDADIDTVKNNDDIVGDMQVELHVKENGGNYVKVYDSELNKILNCSEGADKNKLLALFVYIKGCINEESKVWRKSHINLRENTGINSDRTIENYLKILKEIGLILYKSAGTRLIPNADGTKQIKECVNIFTLNKEGHDEILDREIDREFYEKSESYEMRKKNKNSDVKRSESQIKNNMD